MRKFEFPQSVLDDFQKTMKGMMNNTTIKSPLPYRLGKGLIESMIFTKKTLFPQYGFSVEDTSQSKMVHNKSVPNIKTITPEGRIYPIKSHEKLKKKLREQMRASSDNQSIFP